MASFDSVDIQHYSNFLMDVARDLMFSMQGAPDFLLEKHESDYLSKLLLKFNKDRKFSSIIPEKLISEAKNNKTSSLDRLLKYDLAGRIALMKSIEEESNYYLSLARIAFSEGKYLSNLLEYKIDGFKNNELFTQSFVLSQNNEKFDFYFDLLYTLNDHYYLVDINIINQDEFKLEQLIQDHAMGIFSKEKSEEPQTIDIALDIMARFPEKYDANIDSRIAKIRFIKIKNLCEDENINYDAFVNKTRLKQYVHMTDF